MNFIDCPLTYTANGDLMVKTGTEGTTTYTHDTLGNLEQVNLPNNDVISYTYDGRNRLISKQVNGVTEYRLIYAGQLSPIAKVDGSGNTIETYIYGLGVNSPDYILKDGTNYRVIKDHLGSIRMIVNTSTGTAEKTISYDEFGNIAEETGTFNTIFGFAGGIRDTDTSLTKFGARWYDSTTGRWLEKEPLGFRGAMNFYSYCDGDPVNKIDINGLKIVYPEKISELDKKKIMVALFKLSTYSPTAAELIFHLEISDQNVMIQMGTSYGHYNGVVTWSETNKNPTEPWEVSVPSEIWLAHELIHALHYIHGFKKVYLNNDFYKSQPEEYFTVGLASEGNECSSYPFTENRIRKDYMRYYPELTFRDYYYTGEIYREKRDFNPVVCY